MKFSVFQLSRQGGRSNNEDRMGYCYTRESGLFVVADGMGGHPQGEVAAQIAIQSVALQFQREAQPLLKDVGDFLARATLAAHEAITRHARAHQLADAPRTTLVLAVVQNGQAQWVHCGDSRLYLVRGNTLVARTRDHSYRELNDIIGTTEGPPVNRNVLFTCLGAASRPVYDVSQPVLLLQGDRILLCSDGLWDVVDDDTIVQELARQRVADAVPALVDHALRVAGEDCDNVTAVALQWDTPDAIQGADASFEGEDTFSSTIQVDEGDAALEPLDDGTIERAIAEINATIRRTAERKQRG